MMSLYLIMFSVQGYPCVSAPSHYQAVPMLAYVALPQTLPVSSMLPSNAYQRAPHLKLQLNMA